MRCFAEFRTDIAIGRGVEGVMQGTTPPGYGPTDLQSAYALPSSTRGTGQVVAIIDAYNDPKAVSDLAVYRKQYGLPVCGTSSGCFRKVNQNGQTTNLPQDNPGWSQEISLDLDTVSAVCPNCKILLLEANSASIADLDAAVNRAVAMGAHIISNSFGGKEYTTSDPAFNHPGTVIVASAGDNGFVEGPEQPCGFQYVVCAGGTSLIPFQNSRGWHEVVWNELDKGYGATGSGCSAMVAKPSWQTDPGCPKRSQTDVSFDGDPLTGVAVYDSYPYQGHSGWLVFGGTSVSSPAIAAVYGLAQNAHTVGKNATRRIWTDAGNGLFPVTTGNNGTCSKEARYLCTAGTKQHGVFAGPIGWGTPNGITDF